MTRLKRILQATAALVVGGAAIAGAIITANLADAEPMSCAEWSQHMENFNAKRITFFVAVQDGYAAPEAIGSKLIGACGAGTCDIETPCGDVFRYDYDLSPASGGWRLAEISAHPYFAGAWKDLAAVAAEVKLWDNFSAVQAKCAASLTDAECLAVFRPIGDCWKKPDGTYCRDGRLYGPGAGGVDLCAPAAGDQWYPCNDNGQGKSWGEKSLTEVMLPDDQLVLDYQGAAE